MQFANLVLRSRKESFRILLPAPTVPASVSAATGLVLFLCTNARMRWAVGACYQLAASRMPAKVRCFTWHWFRCLSFSCDAYASVFRLPLRRAAAKGTCTGIECGYTNRLFPIHNQHEDTLPSRRHLLAKEEAPRFRRASLRYRTLP